MDIKEEVKDEFFFLDFDVKKVKIETVTSDSDCHIDIKTEIQEEVEISNLHSQDQREFSSEDPVMGYGKSEIDAKTEIKEEQEWLEGSSTETPCNYDDSKDEDFHPVASSRLCTGVSSAVSSKSPLITAEVSGRDTSFCPVKDNPEYEQQKSVVTEKPSVEDDLSEQSSIEGGEMHIGPLQSKQNTLIHKSERPHKCETCDKSFSWLSHLKTHYLIHEGKKPHQCKICNRSFTQLSHLKTHYLIHEGKKLHKCNICDKSFTRSSHLKTHYLIHEGKKPHKCKICDKSFTQLSHLKKHYLIHEGKSPHQCKICDERFTHLSDLKKHYLIHDGKKLHKCKTCDNTFTQMSSLKRHYLIHEGKKTQM